MTRFYFSIVFFTLFSSFCLGAQTKSGLYFNSFGDPGNPSMLFIHGGPGYNSYTFEYGAAAEMASKGYYTVVFDQRGCGRSAKTSTGDYTFSKATQDITEVIQASGIKQPMLIGHSWGGTLAIEFLKLHPGVSLGAILLDAPVSWPGIMNSMISNTIVAFDQAGDQKDEKIAQNRLGQMFPNGLSAPFNFTLDNISESFVQALQAGLYRPKAYTAEAISIWKEISARSDNKWVNDSTEEPPEGFEKNEHLYEQDFSNDLSANQSIIYAAYGTEDRLFDQTQIQNIAKSLPSRHFAQIVGAAHYSFIDQRSSFIQIADSFFKEAIKNRP